MTNLTLDLAKTIVYSALSSDDAVFKLQQAGFHVKKPRGNKSINIVDFGGPDFIAFSPVYLSENKINVTVCGESVTPSERKAFLESQHQNTSAAPANEQTRPSVGTVACVAEARPDLPVLQESCECSKCKSAHGILSVYAHGLVTVGCPDCWHSDQSLISVMAETFFSQLSTESLHKVVK
jgi:hypothetical protein